MTQNFEQSHEIQDSVDYYKNFEFPKITYGHFSPSPLFCFDHSGYYSNDKSYIIPKADFYLLGLLNSPIHWMLITSMCPFVRGGYYEVRTYFIDTLPIPKATNAQKEHIATLAEACQSTAELRYQLQNSLRQQIPDLCPEGNEPKLNNKLKSWWTLSFDDFKKEIKKQYKQAMSLEQSIQWQDVFEARKQEIQTHSAVLASEEQQLNKAVYELFSLTEKEVSLLEESLR